MQRELPVIDVAGTSFTIDVRLGELRNALPPYNAIRFDDMAETPDAENYRFLFDPKRNEQFILKSDTTELPAHIVCVEIPKMLRLDPIGMKLHFGCQFSPLDDIPVKARHRASLIPRQEAGIDQLLAARKIAQVNVQNHSQRKRH